MLETAPQSAHSLPVLVRASSYRLLPICTRAKSAGPKSEKYREFAGSCYTPPLAELSLLTSKHPSPCRKLFLVQLSSTLHIGAEAHTPAPIPPVWRRVERKYRDFRHLSTSSLRLSPFMDACNR